MSELRRRASETTLPNERPAKRPRFNSQRSADVLVGPLEARFTIRPEVLCASSPFFKAAYERWQKSREPFKLPYDEPKVFQLYLCAAYYREIDNEQLNDQGDVGLNPRIKQAWQVRREPNGPDDKVAQDQRQPQRRSQEVFLLLTKAYVLADKLNDLTSADIIIDKIIQEVEFRDCVVASDSIEYAFKNQAQTSPLRRLFVDLYVHEADERSFCNALPRVPAELVLAVAREFNRLACVQENSQKRVSEVFNQRTCYMERCHYHQHDHEHKRCGYAQSASYRVLQEGRLG
ncbi:hypothetical protein EJ03DRAFT_353766 [Teratosphaeria nubilosa]|uniref:BTB domain-containing protein n=1 Tax=Teratosphaeria nubilosa TaxID=161662 RepID=A0A6G1L162_9PEZI|nr:hypothetical protein EJ03DRAFT_353766 [Teratosphaeria nubilosa]